MIKSEGYKLTHKIKNIGKEEVNLFFDEIKELFNQLNVDEKNKTFVCSLINDKNEFGIILCSRKVFKIEKKENELFIKLVIQNEDLEKINFEHIKDYKYYNNSTFIKVKFDDYFTHKQLLFPLLLNSLKLDTCKKSQYYSSNSPVLYKVITNKKERELALDCANLDVENWKAYLTSLLNEPHFKSIINDSDFYLEKGRQAYLDVKTEFDNFGIDNLPLLANNIDGEFGKLKGTGKTLQLLELLNDDEKKLIEKINLFYAYVDDKALNKKTLNEYEDTRVMAKTNYAQKQFTVDWLRYVSDSNIRENQITLNRILNFFENPKSNLSMISERHRNKINTHLFDKKLNILETSDKEIIDAFSFLNLSLTNENNRGYIITRLLYDSKFKFTFWLYSKDNNMTVTTLENLIKELKLKQLEDDFKYFNINFNSSKQNTKAIKYVWFTEVNSIQKANLGCHYEIYTEKDNIYLDIHFESQNNAENENYYSILKDVIPNEKINWFKWHKSKWGGKNASTSIRHKTYFKFNDDNLVENVYDSLKDLVEVGKIVATLQQNHDFIWVKGNIPLHLNKKDKNNVFWNNDFSTRFNLPKNTQNISIKIGGDLFENIPLYGGTVSHPNFIDQNAKRFLENDLILNHKEFDSIKIYVGYKKTDKEIMKSNTPLNQILFGPPGTGKTYKTKELAVSIIDGEIPSSRDELSTRYKELIESEQIQFSTFHQSMSYEDFVEGLKPILIKEDEKDDVADIGYEIKDGIFKDMCLNAESFKEYSATTNQLNLKEQDFDDKNIFKISLGNTLKSTGNKVYEYCRDNNCIALGWGGDIDYGDVKNKKEIIDKYTENTGLIPSSSDFNIRAINHFKLNMQIGDLVFVSHGNKLLKAVGKIVGEYQYDPKSIKGYFHYRKVEWFFTDIKIPVTKVYEKGFSQQSIYEMQTDKINIPFLTESHSTKKSENSNNVVLIIDEINRGNVSAIFGELITLIEEDKRKGGNEEIEVVLPYSKEPFSVPDNLYIIGTMNTADRSVEALDTALRRRFSFEEIAPNSELIQTVGKLKESDGVIKEHKIDLVEILNTINRRIEKLIDKDHKIGHSYFLSISNVQDLKNVFQKNIIPLLQEYFFGDFGKIGLVIGSGFYISKENEINEDNFFAEVEDFDFGGLYEKKTYDFINVSNMKDDKFKEAIDKLLRN